MSEFYNLISDPSNQIFDAVYTIAQQADEVFGKDNFQNEIIWQGAIGDTSSKNKKIYQIP